MYFQAQMYTLVAYDDHVTYVSVDKIDIHLSLNERIIKGNKIIAVIKTM